jgi:hypothetical protein
LYKATHIKSQSLHKFKERHINTSKYAQIHAHTHAHDVELLEKSVESKNGAGGEGNRV